MNEGEDTMIKILFSLAFSLLSQNAIAACSLFEGAYYGPNNQAASAFTDPELLDFGMVLTPGYRVYTPNLNASDPAMVAEDSSDWFAEPSIPDTNRPPTTISIRGETYRFRCAAS